MRLIRATCCGVAKSTGPSSADASALHSQVISKEANFVTVRLNERAEIAEGLPGPVDVLCSVRALLKKIKQTVLVGDNVQVDSIDWADKRGRPAPKLIFKTRLSSVMLPVFL